jgi:beta-barrel assembly-enhancing protease
MKAAAFVLATLFIAATASPARAQLGGILKGANKAVDAKNKVDDLKMSDQEEKQLGEQVSLQLRNRFGVLQDEKVTKYVTLVGTVLAQASTKPKMDWKFVVLDTDGVNAYAAPGGFVHITKGLLGLMKNEAELAGVLGHEVVHITERHTIKAIQQGKMVNMGGEAAGSGGGLSQQLIARLAAAAFNKIFEGEFSQKDENESDKIGTQLANKVGYAPTGIADVLKKIQARNGARKDRNGMFASHPSMKERLENNEKLIKSEKLNATATAEARYKQNIPFEAKPVTEITMDVDGGASLAGSDKKKAEEDKAAEAKKEEPKKKGGFGSALGGITGNKQSASTQQASSAGARGGVPDRDAKGGPNKNPLGVKITAAEIEAFRKGIAS